ncbi:natterin-3-like, partial [Amblyomma americanum]
CASFCERNHSPSEERAIPTEATWPATDALVSEGATLEWLPGSDGSVPSGALPGGKTASGEQLYIGRARHEGMLIPGKVHPSIKCAFIPYEGKEYRYAEYEVLVSKTISFREAKERRD